MLNKKKRHLCVHRFNISLLYKTYFIRGSILEIIQYFVSELCTAAFLDPKNDDLKDKLSKSIDKRLKSWLHFTLHASPILKQSR